MFEIVAVAGKVMTMDRKGRIGWYEASVLPAGMPLGFFSYQLFGKPHAVVGPAPPPGALNPKFTWHPGVPVANVRPVPVPSAVAPASVPSPVAAQVAVDTAWEQAVIRTHVRVRG